MKDFKSAILLVLILFNTVRFWFFTFHSFLKH